jgi:hypothetical protein
MPITQIPFHDPVVPPPPPKPDPEQLGLYDTDDWEAPIAIWMRAYRTS